MSILRKNATWLMVAVWLAYSLGALWWLESDAAAAGRVCTARIR